MNRSIWACPLVLVLWCVGNPSVEGAGPPSQVVDDDGMGEVGNCNAATTCASTINAAITAATAGDAIQVCPGTYSENVILNKMLELRGAQVGVDARGRVMGAPDPAVESVVSAASPAIRTLELQTGSAGSSIDGFAFSGGTRAIESTSGPINDLTIQNNHFGGFTNNAIFLNDTGIDITVFQNVIDGSSKTGGGGLFHLDQDNFDGFQFLCNWVLNGQVAGTGTGFFVDGNHNVGLSANRPPKFNQNRVDNNTTGANLGRFAFEFGEIADNSFVNNGNPTTASDGLQGGIQNSSITRNTFSGNRRWGLALTGFSGSNSGDATRGAQNNTVTENCFSSNGTGIVGTGDVVFNQFQFPGTISTNRLSRNTFGSSPAVHYNEAVPAEEETIDCSANWWGNSTGPTLITHPSGTGGPITGAASHRIDFTPWLNTGADTSGTCTNGFQGDFSVLNVDDDSPQFGPVTRVQEGVNLVTASTVNVLPGTYEEQVVIAMDDLILQGSGSGSNPAVDSIILSPMVLTYFFTTSANNFPIIGVHDADGVQINDLRVDGAGRGNSNFRFVGIGIHNSSTDVTDCAVTAIRETPFSGTQHGVGILAANNTGGPYTVNVSGCEIDDYQKNGMVLAFPGLTANVSNCTVTGVGPTGVTAQNGIQISSGAGGTIEGCTVSGHMYTGPGFASTGLLLFSGTTVDVTDGNQINDNFPGVYYQDTNGLFDGNVVSNLHADSWDGLYAFNTALNFEGGSAPRRVAAPFEEDTDTGGGNLVDAMSITVTNSEFVGHDKLNSWGVSAFSDSVLSVLTVTCSTVRDFDLGVVAYYDPGVGLGGPVSVTAHHNSIFGNVSYGFFSSTPDVQNATDNYWGAVSGPLDALGTDEAGSPPCFDQATMVNADGLGNGVTDLNVDYCPWLLTGPVCCVDAADCDDMNACTIEVCSAGGLCEYSPVDCDDDNVCTDDTCDPITGCVNTPNTEPCDDGNACTTDTCQGGACVGAVTIAPGELNGWAGISRRTASGTFVVGPPVPPLGAGSYEMATGPGGSGPPLPGGDSAGLGGKTWMSTEAFNGTSLSSISALSYSTYIQAVNSNTITIAINMYVDLDGDGARDTTLVFEPYYSTMASGGTQPNLAVGTWQTWDAIQAGAAKWWYTAAFGPLTNPFNDFQPLSYYVGLFPNAQIVTWYSPGNPIRSDGWGFNFVAGQNSAGPPWNDFVGNLDNFTFVNGSPYTANFEADALCDDGDVCNGPESCDPATGCLPGMPLNCDDLNPCTDDSCDPINGCVNTPNNNPCDDAVFCNGADTCDAGSCSLHMGDPCAAGDECNECCNEAAENCFCPSGTPCGDQSDTDCDNPNTCDGAGNCQNNGELDGAPCTPDANGCTDDVCSNRVCAHPNSAPGTACGIPSESDCDNPDTCNGMGSCLSNHEPNGSLCTPDANECTSDICNGGFCFHPAAPQGTPCGSPSDTDCDNPDTCDFYYGVCLPNNAPNGTSCNDGQFCNGNDSCAAGQCTGPGSTGDPCAGGSQCNNCCNEAMNHCYCAAEAPCGLGGDTACDNPDSCNGSGSCSPNTEPNGTGCSDGNACTAPDTCQSGSCAGGPPVDCNDGDICNGTETCVSPTGCVAGAPLDCDDHNECTLDFCDASGCYYEQVDCDDGDPCTIDTCVEPMGCMNEAECLDDGDCAAGEVCSAEGCCVPSGVVGYALDIREKKCPNKLKCNSNGTIKVYVAGDIGLNVDDIDLSTLKLCLCGGSDCILPDKPPRIKDKVGPHLTECGDCSCKKLKKDYIDDIEIKFKHLCDLIDPSLPEGSLVDWEVRGNLLNGTLFKAHDCTIIDRPGSGQP